MTTSEPFPVSAKRRDPGQVLLSAARWRWYEWLAWLAALAFFFLVPTRLALLTEIVTLGLLALSIDLVLGYAGIVTLGQGAFFGLGAYARASRPNGAAAVFL